MSQQKIKIDKEALYKLYMEKVDRICEECDWVTDFGPKEIVDMISIIIEKNPELLKADD
jgi:hypothetical protein